MMETKEIAMCIFCHNRKAEELGVGIIYIGDPKNPDAITMMIECLDTESCIFDVREMMGI